MIGQTTLPSIPNEWAPVVYAAGVAMLVYVVLRMRKQTRKPTGPGGPVASTLTPMDVRAMAQELQGLLVELHETSRRIAAQIDNRYQKLDALLAEADAKIKRLEELSGQIENVSPTNTMTTPTVDPRYQRIYELADRGHSSTEIAQEVGTQPGEVELILNLRK